MPSEQSEPRHGRRSILAGGLVGLGAAMAGLVRPERAKADVGQFTEVVIDNDGSGVPLTVKNSGTERARIDANGNLKATVPSGFNPALEARIDGESQPRLRLAAGAVQFGDGSAAPDMQIQRLPAVGSGSKGTLSQDGRRFDRSGWLNVRDFGAKGDGSADDRSAIQAAIDAASTAGRATVYFPVGVYAISASLVLPNDKAIELLGAAHFTANNHATGGARIQRTSGATFADLVRNDQSGIPTARYSGAIRNLQLYNGSSSARCAFFNATNHAIWDCVEFVGIAANGGTQFSGVWNSNFRNCKWHGMGGASNQAAMFITDDGFLGGNSNTVHWEGCEWEVNTGADIYLDDGGGSVAAGCLFTNCKVEASSSHAFPEVNLVRARYAMFASSMFFLAHDLDGPIVRQVSTAERNTFVGCSFSHGSMASGTQYLIDQLGGTLSCTGCVMDNYGSNIVAWHIAPGLGQHAAQGAGNIYYDTSPAKRSADGRSGGAGPTSMP